MIARRCTVVFALILCTASAKSLESDFTVFFATKRPWDYPVAKDSGDLAKLALQAEQDYRTVEPRLKLHHANTFEDSQRHLLFFAFLIAEDSPVFPTDFYLVYVYDRSQQRFIGRVHIPMA